MTDEKITQATLCFLLKPSSRKILLAMKKRGFGAGKWNGIGGKVEEGESIETALARECKEEILCIPSYTSMHKYGVLDFQFLAKPEWDQQVHVFSTLHWKGVPQETEEMKPQWFNYGDIPYTTMWKDDSYWLPLLLQGNRFEGSFLFGADNESILDYQLETL